MTPCCITWLHALQAAISAVLVFTIYGWVQGLLYVVGLGASILMLTAILLVFVGSERDG